MNILFDVNVPWNLRRFLAPHFVATTQQKGWRRLENGDLLAIAQAEFDVFITVDSNLDFQQHIGEFAIAVVVLRGEQNSPAVLSPLMPQVVQLLETCAPGEVSYVYTEIAAAIDKRKGKYRGKTETS